MIYQRKSVSNKGKTVPASINASALLYFLNILQRRPVWTDLETVIPVHHVTV